ncbi:unnamed protein product [Camellia sinensis]
MVAPYNTFYSQLEAHMDQVGVEATINRWDDLVALGVVDPHDSSEATHEAFGKKDDLALCAKQLLKQNYKYATVRSEKDEDSCDSDSTCKASEHKREDKSDIHNNLGEIKQILKETQLEDSRKHELSSALHVYFKEWLYASGNIRQLYCLEGD